MIKVLQTIIDKGNGNCMQAVGASLLELPLNEVPHFLEFDKTEGTCAHLELLRFLRLKGYGYCIWTSGYTNGKGEFMHLHEIDFTKRILEIDNGVNGYFYASVKSQTFENCSHAVVINKNMEIVHDPNPNQSALKLKETDILDIVVCGDNWYIDIKGNLIIK